MLKRLNLARGETIEVKIRGLDIPMVLRRSARARQIQSASERGAPGCRAHHAALFELRRRRRVSLASSRLAERACRRAVGTGALHPWRHRSLARARSRASLRGSVRRRGVVWIEAAEDAKAAPAWPEGARVGVRRLPRLYVAGAEEHAPRRLFDWLKRQAHLDLKTRVELHAQASQSRAEAPLRARPDHALGIVLDLGRAVLLLAARARAAFRARLSRRARGRPSRPHESRAALLGSRRAHHAAPRRGADLAQEAWREPASLWRRRDAPSSRYLAETQHRIRRALLPPGEDAEHALKERRVAVAPWILCHGSAAIASGRRGTAHAGQRQRGLVLVRVQHDFVP